MALAKKPVVTLSPCMGSVPQREGVGCGVWFVVRGVSPLWTRCHLGGMGVKLAWGFELPR